jgi:hypothetical protein
MADWAYLGEAMSPMKTYPGVMYVRPRKTRPQPVPDFD